VSTEYIWETFDSLFKTVHRQGRRVEELETRLAELERRLQERSTAALQPSQPQQPKAVEPLVSEMPAERAA
jgi:BMFP domain-containing protein YqiC